MKIHIINENDWEKVYELDKSIIRVGSQVTCDVQLRDGNIQPLIMQIVRSGGTDEKYVIRFFADNIILTRGDQVFPVSQVTPYDILDGDKFTFSNYRMIISLEDEKARIRTTTHISAEMFLTKRDLALESSINGMLLLKNLGTEKPCQFRMRITGIPLECVQFAPMPYLYPGSSSSVGFIISHLHTKPSPGFHTVSIIVSAPEDYFGEELEFNQDIYVHPVFNNIFVLEDDSKKLSGINSKQAKALNPVDNNIPVPAIPDTHQMNVDEEVTEEEKPAEMPVRIVGSDDAEIKNVFSDSEEDEEETYKITRKKRPVVVIHNENENAFDEPDIDEAAQSDNSAPQAKSQAAYMRIDSEDNESSEKPAQTEPAESSSEAPVIKKKKRKKKSQFVLNDDTVMVSSIEEEPVREAAEEKKENSVKPRKKKPAVQEPENELVIKEPEKETASQEPENELVVNEPEKELTESVNPDVQSEAAEEKPYAEPVEISNSTRAKRNRSKRVKKDSIADSSTVSVSDSMEQTSDVQMEPVSELLPDQTTDSVQIHAENEKTVEADDVSSKEVLTGEKPVFEIQPVENDQTDNNIDSENNKIVQTDFVAEFHQNPEENAKAPDSLIQLGTDSEGTELQPEQTENDRIAEVDKKDNEIEKQPNANFVKTLESEENIPVAVVSGKGNFDDPAEFPSDESITNPDEEKPDVIVMKGGGFDQ